MKLRPHARGRVWAPTGEEAAAWDRRAIETVGVPQRVLMDNAGRAAAAVLARLFPEGPVLAVVGAGNNGGDALVLLRTLRAWGREAAGVLVADRPLPEPLLHGWDVPLVPDAELSDDGWAARLGHAAVIVDGILGTGARGAPRPRQAEAIRRMFGCGRPVLALDLPSGVDAGTGAVPGEAVRADVTVALGAPKLGALLHPGRALVGRHVAVEIGFPPLAEGEAAAEVVVPAWARRRIPARSTDTHKNAVGRVLVVGGGRGMAGALLLAARAALRTGAGIVRACTHPANREIVQAALPEAIQVDASDAGALEAALEASDAVVVGPGLGTDDEARTVLERVAAGPARPTLLDADALNLAAVGAIDLAALAAGRALLLTPHPGEMGRLLGGSGAAPDRSTPAGVAPPAADRPAVARHAAERFGCAVLFKGAPSLVAAPGRALLVDAQGSSDLAAAGMGDSLAGVAGCLMAQGLDPTEAGAVALHLTGRAATIAGRGAALVPSDVIERLPDALVEEPAGADGPLALPFVTFDADPAR